jgi:formylmethanofuran dehydrogenase subunit C
MTVSSIALNLDPFGKGRKAAPDSVQKVEQKVDELVESAYKKYLNLPDIDYFDKESRPLSKKVIIKYDIVLCPSQIELLLERIIGDNPIGKAKDWSTGLFLSTLIQNSYTYGLYNSFTLITGDFGIDGIGYRLRGTKNNRIALAVYGDVGYACGELAENFDLNIQGDAGEWCGEHAEHSNVNIQGNANGGCGWDAKHSSFKIQGNAGDWCGIHAIDSSFKIRGDTGRWSGDKAEYTEFNIYGNVSYGCGDRAGHTRFIVHSKAVYDRLMRYNLPKTNKIVLVDDAGNILEERQK